MNELTPIKQKEITITHERFDGKVIRYDPESSYSVDCVRIKDIWFYYTGVEWSANMKLNVLRKHMIEPRLVEGINDRIEQKMTQHFVYAKMYEWMDGYNIVGIKQRSAPVLLFPREKVIEFISDYIQSLRTKKSL